MQTLYYKLRAAIAREFPDHEIKKEPDLESNPDSLDCWLVVNSGKSFAVRIYNLGSSRLFVSIWPTADENRGTDGPFEFVEINGVTFSPEDGEDFVIKEIEDSEELNVLNLISPENKRKEYVANGSDLVVEAILASLGKMNPRRGGTMDSGG